MVTLKKTEKNLTISPDDLEALAECRDLCEALEHPLCNGWEWIAPEEVAALTSGEIITDDAERDDDGNLLAVGRVYWNSYYAVHDTLADLRAGRTVTWVGVD